MPQGGFKSTHKEMKLSVKLVGGFFIGAALGVGIGLSGIFSLTSIEAADKVSFDTGTTGNVQVSKMITAFDAIKVATRDEALSSDETGNQAALAAYTTGMSDMTKALKEASTNLVKAEDKANYAKFVIAWNAYIPLTKKVMDLGVANKNAEAAAVMRSPEMAKARTDMADAMNYKVDFNVKLVQELNNANVKLTETSIRIVIIVLIIVVVIAVGLAPRNHALDYESGGWRAS